MYKNASLPVVICGNYEQDVNLYLRGHPGSIFCILGKKILAVMNKGKIQYVTDLEGNRKAVMIPIEEWERIEEQIKALLEYGLLKESLKQGFLEVKEIISGKEKVKSAKDFLDEL